MSDDERDVESDADKRAHHNALERKRRDHIKDSFTSLRDSIPSLNGEKIQASRAQILKKAAEYIQSMRRKNTSHQQDIEDLRKQNRVLEDQIRQLEKGKSSSGFATSLLEKQKNDSISSLDGISDSEAGTSDGDTGNADGMEYMAETGEPSPKRAKTETSERPVGAKVAAVRA